MRHTERIIKDSSIYTVSTIISQLLGVFTSIAMRRFLTPEMMGIWTTFLVILNYSLFAHLGVFTAVEVKIPYLRGRNENDTIQHVRNAAFTLAIVISTMVIAIAFLGSYIFAQKITPDIILGIRILAFIIMATLFYNLYIVMMRADKKFFLLSKGIVFNSLAMLLFVSIFTYFFKLRGIYFATLFATAASWLYLYFKTGYRLNFYFKGEVAKMLAKIGLPILLSGIAYTILLSIDKIMIVKMLGPRELGYYSIAILALTYTHNFPKLFSIVIFPTMQEEFGKSSSHKDLLRYVRQPSLIMAYIFPVVLATAYFAIPVLVYYVLPKYSDGIISMKILLIGCFFISLVPLTHNFIIAINKQTVLIPITLAAVACGIGLNYLMITAGYGISGVALGTSIAYFIYFAIMFLYASIHSGSISNIYKYLLEMCAPLFYSFTVIIILENLITVKPTLARSIAQAAIFYIFYIPVLWYIDRKTLVISNFFKKTAKPLPGAEAIFPNIPSEEQI